MGKIRRLRRKYHLTAANIEKKNTGTDLVESQLKHVPLIPPNGVTNEMEIALTDLEQQCKPKRLDADQKSVISLSRASIVTGRSEDEKKMKKKDKIKLRRQTFLEKIHELQMAKNKEAKEKRLIQKQKRAGSLNMNLLIDALPTLEDLLATSDQSAKPLKQRAERKQKGPKKYKAVRNQMLRDVTLFRKVLQHPAYKADPERAIMTHLQNTLK